MTKTSTFAEKRTGRGAKIVASAKVIDTHWNPRIDIENFMTFCELLKKYFIREIILILFKYHLVCKHFALVLVIFYFFIWFMSTNMDVWSFRTFENRVGHFPRISEYLRIFRFFSHHRDQVVFRVRVEIATQAASRVSKEYLSYTIWKIKNSILNWLLFSQILPQAFFRLDSKIVFPIPLEKSLESVE